ncbi:hypothetical protein, partial, partial [Parasitella parasitica]
NKNESIRLHSAKWQHLLSFIPSNQITDDQKINLFTQSLSDKGLRSTLITYIDIKEVNKVEDVITKAIEIENKARLIDYKDTVQHTIQAKSAVPDDPMEVDYYEKSKYNHTKKPFKGKQKLYSHKKGDKKEKSHKFNHKQHNKKNEKNDNVPRGYDKQGNPLCGHCGGRHYNFKCDQNNISTIDTKDDNDHVELTSSINTIDAKPVHAVNTINSYTPTTPISIANQIIHALWDTGAGLSAVSSDVCIKLGLTVHKENITKYTDVNQKSTSTMGTTTIEIFSQHIQFHVIQGLARDVIIGWDLMTKWKVEINTFTKTISIHTNMKTTTVGYFTTADSE